MKKLSNTKAELKKSVAYKKNVYKQKTSENQKLNFSRSALFHMKTRVCHNYFVYDCL